MYQGRVHRRAGCLLLRHHLVEGSCQYSKGPLKSNQLWLLLRPTQVIFHHSWQQSMMFVLGQQVGQVKLQTLRQQQQPQAHQTAGQATVRLLMSSVSATRCSPSGYVHLA